MEAFGVVATVVGLIPVCYSAFEYIETACRAKEGAQKQYQRILMQKGVCVNLPPVFNILIR